MFDPGRGSLPFLGSAPTRRMLPCAGMPVRLKLRYLTVPEDAKNVGTTRYSSVSYQSLTRKSLFRIRALKQDFFGRTICVLYISCSDVASRISLSLLQVPVEPVGFLLSASRLRRSSIHDIWRLWSSVKKSTRILAHNRAQANWDHSLARLVAFLTLLPRFNVTKRILVLSCYCFRPPTTIASRPAAQQLRCVICHLGSNCL